MKGIIKCGMLFLLAISVAFCYTGCGKTVGEGSTVYYSYYEDDGTGAETGTNSTASDKNSDDKDANSQATSKNESTASKGSNSSSKKISMLLWYTFSDAEKARADAFTKETGIKLSITKTTQGLYQTKLASMVMANNAPDLVAMSANSFPMVILKDLIQPVDGYIDMSDSGWDLEMMNALKWNGKYYGLSVKGSQMEQQFVIYYNKTLFDSWGVKTPTEYWKSNNWNWDTFRECAINMTGTKGGKTITGFAPAAVNFWEYFSISAGVPMVSYNSSTSSFSNNMTNPTVANAFKFANQLIYTDKCAKTQGDLTSGDLAMMGGGEWYMWKGDKLDKNMTDEWSVVPWPSPKGQTPTLPCDSQLWCLGNGAANPQGAVSFIRYWLDMKNNTKVIYATANNKSKSDEYYNMSKIHTKLWDMNKCFNFSNGVVSYSDVNAYNNLVKNLVSNGANSVDSTLASNSSTVDANIQLILKDSVNIKK